MSMEYSYRGSVCSDINEIKPFIESTLCSIKKIVKNEDMIFDIKLILYELVINGVIHGNKSNCCKSVYLTIKIEDDSIMIKVVDEGEGIKYDFNSYDYRKCKHSGRGLVLVEALTDSLILNKNEIVCKKLLK